MNDADWDFLKPWLKILAPVMYLPDVNQPLNGSGKDQAPSLQPRVRYLGINPFVHVIGHMFSTGGTGSPDVKLLATIGCAMEIVALALRIEPRVWGLLCDRSGESLLDMTAYDPKQLGAGLLVKCTGVEMMAEMYGAMFVMGGGGMQVQGYARAQQYDADKKRLQRMWKGSNVYQYQIPLAIEIARSRGEIPITAMRKLFVAIATSMNVETAIPPRMMRSGWAAYRLRSVFVEACDGTRSEMAQLNALGVSITGARYVHYMSHETLQAIADEPQSALLKAVSIDLDSTDGLARLYSLLSCDQRIGSLMVELAPDCDFDHLAHVLLATNATLPALHRLDIKVIESSVDAQAFEALAERAETRGPLRNARLLKKINTTMAKGAVFPLLQSEESAEKVRVLLVDGSVGEVAASAVEVVDVEEGERESTQVKTLTSPIETFSLETKPKDEPAAMAAVKLVTRWLPKGLKRLTLDVMYLTDACLSLILEAFPVLQMLRVKNAQVTTTEPLLRAFEQQNCKIQALELGAYGLDVTALFATLADPKTRLSKTLKQLQLNCPYDEEPREAFVSALKKMLHANQSLEFVKLAKTRDDKTEISEQLSGVRALATPRKLALISAICQAAKAATPRALGSLDSQTVNEIIRLAEEPRFRVVCVV